VVDSRLPRTALAPIEERPRPIHDASAQLVRWLGVAGSVVLGLVGWGVLTAAQGDAVVGLLGLIPGVVNAIATLLTAIGIRRRSEPLVTPLTDPRNNTGERLVATLSPLTGTN
jgi:hypothetical protein